MSSSSTFWPSSTFDDSATSPAMRVTPTTEIGPFGSRASSLNAACATPFIFSGMCSTTPAVCLMLVPSMPGTAPGP